MPADGFVAVEAECWKCHRATPMFYWPGIGVRREAPQPWPRTVRLRYSNTTEDRYLANNCIHCDSLQGEFFLQEGLRNAIGDAPDFDELDDLFFRPLTREEADRVSGGLTIEEIINIVAPMPRGRW